jgi:putative protease
VDGSFFVPAAMLKELRRDFWNFFAPLLAKHDFFPEHPAKMDGFYSEAAAVKNLPPPAVGKCFHIPGFIPETELDIWQKKINDAYAAGQREFSAGHWHAFELLKNLPDAKIHLCYPFHISNSFAAGVAAGLGAVSGEISPECPAVPKKMLAAASIIPLRQLSVPPPLLVSRIPLAAGEWECGGKKFICRRKNGLSSLHIYQTPEIAGEDQLQFLSGQTAE